MAEPVIVDLFAGPGGWDVALRTLALGPVIGIEWDAAACATRAAAGHLTIRADVSKYPTAPFRCVTGLIASPPCPTFSAAGKGEGRDDLPYLHAATEHIGKRGWTDPWSLHQWSDPRTPLVLEPLRWVAALRPEWVACEQVPAVLPLWEQYASIWQDEGYSVWAGVLNSADFGVPQTRERAIVVASRTRTALPPEPTHCKGGASTLLGELAPWVSMAEALGWGASERPCVTISAGGTETGGAEPIHNPRRFVERERERERVGYRRTRGAGMNERHGERPDTPIDEPAPTITSKARSDVWVVDRRTNSKAAGGGMAPTVPVPMDRPAPTLTGKGGHQWCFLRPATAVCGDPRLSPPGFRGRAEDYDAEGNYTGKRSMDDAVKLTPAEALILQSFPPDYPVQGTKTKQFEQIGNAIPPGLALAILRRIAA